jgi:hypothetical protein
MFVKLREDWPGGRFQRSVRDKEGAVTETIQFAPGVPVEIPDDEEDPKRQAIARDLGVSLVEVVPHKRRFIRKDELEEIQRGEVAEPVDDDEGRETVRRPGGGRRATAHDGDDAAVGPGGEIPEIDKDLVGPDEADLGGKPNRKRR